MLSNKNIVVILNKQNHVLRWNSCFITLMKQIFQRRWSLNFSVTFSTFWDINRSQQQFHITWSHTNICACIGVLVASTFDENSQNEHQTVSKMRVETLKKFVWMYLNRWSEWLCPRAGKTILVHFNICFVLNNFYFVLAHIFSLNESHTDKMHI